LWLVSSPVSCQCAAQGNADARAALHVDVLVKLQKANVVFDVGHLVVVGDMPFVLGELGLLASDCSAWNTQGTRVAVFHGDIAYLVLNNDACDSGCHVKTGNAFGKSLEGLMKQGVQIELCGATAEANHWGNANLLPGVKANGNAMVTGVTQLRSRGTR
jgi:intracellular sulfur oxidation DsrE/DsrF family protein